jgi:hypothetical protein
VESARHRGHVITSGVDVAFTVVGCVPGGECVLSRNDPSALRCHHRRLCRSITDVDDLLSMTGAMLTDDTGR